MKSRIVRLLVIAGGLAALLVPLSARSALASIPTPASGITWGQNQYVEYRWKEGSEPPGWAKTAMNAAAADSNSSRKAKAATFHYDSSGAGWLAYTDDLPTNWAIGYTVRNIPTSFNIRMRPHGTRWTGERCGGASSTAPTLRTAATTWRWSRSTSSATRRR
jgi:hypothetical protein